MNVTYVNDNRVEILLKLKKIEVTINTILLYASKTIIL